MKDTTQAALHALVADLRFNLTLSPWARSQTPDTWRLEAAGEMTELVNAKTTEERKGETADTLCDLIHMILAHEAQGDFTLEDVVAAARAKLRRRKPWLFSGQVPPATPEEEKQIWEEVKMRERNDVAMYAAPRSE